LRQRRLRTILGLLAGALTAQIYRSALDNPFVFDDRSTILLNPSLIDPWDLRAVLFHNLVRPVVNASYAFDRYFWGFSSFGFHVTNVVLHTAAVGLFYGWCTRALSDRGQTRVRQGSNTGQTAVGPLFDPDLTPEWPAFFAASVFGLHPAMTQAVQYVSARSELLGACGVLVALIYARRAIVVSSANAGAIAAFFGLIALGSCAAAAALPVLVLTYDAWVLRDPGWRRRLWRVYIPAMTMIGLAATWPLRAILAADRVPPRSLLDNMLTQAIVIWRYAALLFAPVRQSIVHDVRWISTPVDPIALVALAGVVAAIAAAVWIRRSAPLVAFGIVWFVTALAPTSLVPLRDPMMEQRVYMAAPGLLLALVAACSRPLATRRTVRFAALVAVLVLSALTRARNAVWSEPVRLWQEAVWRAPNAWQARYEYAETLQEAGQCDDALREYDAALRINPRLAAASAARRSCELRRLR
jgi:protein O-mannosyl-transferase